MARIPYYPLTGRTKVAWAGNEACIEEALRINSELRLLMDGSLMDEPMTRKKAIGVLAKRYSWGDDPKADQAFSRWLRRGLALARKKHFDP
jgi:hypothetical protein